MDRPIKMFILLCFISGANSYAQVKLSGFVAFNYSNGIPSGDLKNFIPNRSLHGANFDYRHFFRRDLSLGIRVGWNAFKNVFPRGVYDTDKGTVSAVQTRFLCSLPFLITSYYYFRSSKYVMPYIGGGIGIYDVLYQKWFGVVPVNKTILNFGFSPEVGIMFPFKNSGIGILVNGKFNNVFYSHNEIRHLRYFEANIGIYYGNF